MNVCPSSAYPVFDLKFLQVLPMNGSTRDFPYLYYDDYFYNYDYHYDYYYYYYDHYYYY